MCELYVELGNINKVVILSDNHLILYEEIIDNDLFAEQLYQKYGTLAVKELVVVTHGFLDNTRFEDGLAAFSFRCGKETYYCNLIRKTLEELDHLADQWGISAKFYDKLGYYRYLTAGRAIFIDEMGSAFCIIHQDEGIRNIHYVTKENLVSILSDYKKKQVDLFIDATMVYKNSLLTQYKNLEHLDDNTQTATIVKAALSLFAFTTKEAAKTYEVTLDETDQDQKEIKPKAKEGSSKSKKQKCRISMALSAGILFFTLLMGFTFTINQYLYKDTIAVESNNVQLELEVEQSKRELKHKQEFYERKGTRKEGEITANLYNLKINGYLGKITFNEGKTQVLIYLKNKKDLPKTKHMLDQIADVKKIRSLPEIQTGGKWLKKFEIVLSDKADKDNTTKDNTTKDNTEKQKVNK